MDMSYREQIDLFLDGELPAEQRPQLFAALASSDELQAEFHQALTIRLSARRYAQQLVPPHALTARIIAAAAPPAPPRAQKLWHSLVSPIALVAVGAVVLGFLVGRLTSPPAPVTTPQQTALPSPLPTQTQTLTIAESQTLQQPVTETPPVGDDLPSRVSVAAETPSSPLHSGPNVPLLHIAQPSAIGSWLQEVERTPQKAHPILASPPQTIPDHIETPPPQSNDEFIISIRRTNTVMLRQADLIQPDGSNPLHNTIASVEYRERNVALVIQAGSEQFPIYQVQATSNGQPSYSLQQQLWWIGGGMRVYAPRNEANAILSTVRPVAGIMLGSSAYGVLGRIELGLVWEPLPNVGMQFLLEGMVHSHGVNRRWEHAEKLSTSIGLALRF